MVQASLCFGRRTQGPCSAATRVPTAAESAPTKDTHTYPELWPVPQSKELSPRAMSQHCSQISLGSSHLSVIRVFSGLYPNLHKDSGPCWAASGPTRCSPAWLGPACGRALPALPPRSPPPWHGA